MKKGGVVMASFVARPETDEFAPEKRTDSASEKNAIARLAPWVTVECDLPLGYAWRRVERVPKNCPIVATVYETDLPTWILNGLSNDHVLASTHSQRWRPEGVVSDFVAVEVRTSSGTVYLMPMVVDYDAVDPRTVNDLNEARGLIAKATWNYAPLIRTWEPLPTDVPFYVVLPADSDSFDEAGGVRNANGGGLVVNRPWRIPGFTSLHHCILFEGTIFRPVCDDVARDLDLIRPYDILRAFETGVPSRSANFVVALYGGRAGASSTEERRRDIGTSSYEYRAEGQLRRLEALRSGAKYRAFGHAAGLAQPIHMRPRQILCSNQPSSLHRFRNDPASAAIWTNVLRDIASLKDGNINIMHIITGSLGPVTDPRQLSLRMEYAVERSLDLTQLFALKDCTTRVYDAHLFSGGTREVDQNTIQNEYIDACQRLMGAPQAGRLHFFAGTQAECKLQFQNFLRTNDINLIFLEGGNTHWLLQRTRGSGFDDILVNFEYYIGGSSAGTNVQGAHVGCQAYKCQYAPYECDPLFDAPTWNSYMRNTSKTCTSVDDCEWNSLELTNRAHYCHYRPALGAGIQDMYIKFRPDSSPSRMAVLTTYPPYLLADEELLVSNHDAQHIQLPADSHLLPFDYNIREARRINADMLRMPITAVQF